MSTPPAEHKPPQLNTIALLGRAYSLLGFQIVDGVVGTGIPTKPKHSAVFAQFGPGTETGRRATDLARAAGMTPQSMGELIDEMEVLGYVRREPDPTDRRAKLIVLTELGESAVDAGERAVVGVESRIVDALGPQGHNDLRSLLQRLLEDDGPPRSAP